MARILKNLSWSSHALRKNDRDLGSLRGIVAEWYLRGGPPMPSGAAPPLEPPASGESAQPSVRAAPPPAVPRWAENSSQTERGKPLMSFARLSADLRPRPAARGRGVASGPPAGCCWAARPRARSRALRWAEPAPWARTSFCCKAGDEESLCRGRRICQQCSF